MKWTASYNFKHKDEADSTQKILHATSKDMKESLSHYITPRDDLKGKIELITNQVPDELQHQIAETLTQEYERSTKRINKVKDKKYKELIHTEHNKMKLNKVKGDGNCYFRSLAVGLYDDEERHGEVREKVVAHMEQNKLQYESYIDGPFDTHIQNMKKVREEQRYGVQMARLKRHQPYGLTINIYSVNGTTIHRQCFKPTPDNAGQNINIQFWESVQIIE